MSERSFSRRQAFSIIGIGGAGLALGVASSLRISRPEKKQSSEQLQVVSFQDLYRNLGQFDGTRVTTSGRIIAFGPGNSPGFGEFRYQTPHAYTYILYDPNTTLQETVPGATTPGAASLLVVNPEDSPFPDLEDDVARLLETDDSRSFEKQFSIVGVVRPTIPQSTNPDDLSAERQFYVQLERLIDYDD